ncbi:hypothetical protein CDAR_37051 [Caerostris darwini]|uniref:Uncharacterized protein n=1 Tax=Caerostris darwini TaxID=1538125 RepID=A0AAV4TPD5_9ARAC|nr:hypothetical protein CDAR_37051 [Caerostris darwini]
MASYSGLRKDKRPLNDNLKNGAHHIKETKRQKLWKVVTASVLKFVKSSTLTSSMEEDIAVLSQSESEVNKRP